MWSANHVDSPIRHRLRWTVGGFGALVVVVCGLAPLVGSTSVSLTRAFDTTMPWSENVDAQIFFIARLPRVLAAALVGSALAMAGVVFQALLRNPLASPDTLGVSAGASLGAMTAITLNAAFSVAGIPALPLASFVGALGAFGVVALLSLVRQRGATSLVLLLGGVTVTALLSAVIGMVQYVADATQTFRTARWLLGSLDVASYAPIGGALLPLALACAGFMRLPRRLDLFSLGADAAATRGVDVRTTERLALASASLATGAAVSLGGPVGFVGIIVPHLVRLVVGADHRLVLPASALLGAAFLVLCDLVARTALAPMEVPVGIVTALLGGPVFLWLLLRQA